MKTIGIGRVNVHGSFAPNGSSALVAANTYGKGFSVARSGVGLYTITFDNTYPELVSAICGCQVADTKPTIAQFGDYVAASKTLQLRVLQAALSAGAAAGRMIGIPLVNVREVDSNDIPALTDTPLSNDPSGFGGLLCKSTTPILEFANGDTDSALQLNWAAGNANPIVFQVPLPGDLDTASDLVLKFRAKMGGGTDTPSIDADSYFNEGDTKVSDASDALGAAWAEQTITIAAADVPTGAKTLTCELTPQAHGADALLISSMWLEYTSTQGTEFVLADQSADANARVSFECIFRNTSVDY
jgi:hypothetical protein